MFKNPNQSLGISTAGIERVRVSNEGVSIGTAANPTERLQVNGNIRFDGALKPNNISGNSGQVLVSAGEGNAPTWGADMSTVSRIYHTQTENPTTLLYNYSGIIVLSGIPAGFTNEATVLITIRSPGATSIAHNVRVHSIEISNNTINFGWSNTGTMNGATNYLNVTFNVTLIQ